jgi:AcrR family transcriptional regulator
MTTNASRTARERARAELTREITAEARRQLAVHGAGELSLRAVARELGMASSAVYRYFPSRDDLLTALIIEAYDAIGAAAETAAGAAPAAARVRWRAACHAIRAWALAHPHEYALIYGSPVPGYHAPQATVPAAIRVAELLGGLLPAARPPQDGPQDGPLPAELTRQAGTVADAIAPGVPAAVVTRGMIALTQLYGMVSFELFGQLVGSFDPADEFFGYAVERMADLVGLPPD